jgi:predicted HicB family RNase H-like nuclease
MATMDRERPANHRYPDRLSAAVTPELADAVRAKARREGSSVSALVRRKLRDEIDPTVAEDTAAVAA